MAHFIIARRSTVPEVKSSFATKAFKDLVVNTAISLSPNLVADEFQSQGVPHKLVGLRIEAISEQIECTDRPVRSVGSVRRIGTCRRRPVVPVLRVMRGGQGIETGRNG